MNELARGTDAVKLVTETLQKTKYCNPWVSTLEVDTKGDTIQQVLSELRSDLMDRVIATVQDSDFEVTAVEVLTSLVRSKTPGFLFLMSGDTPFERVPDDGVSNLHRILAKYPNPDRALYIVKVEKIPWVFDPVESGSPHPDETGMLHVSTQGQAAS